jgi:hypothetical protein
MSDYDLRALACEDPGNGRADPLARPGDQSGFSLQAIQIHGPSSPLTSAGRLRPVVDICLLRFPGLLHEI